MGAARSTKVLVPHKQGSALFGTIGVCNEGSNWQMRKLLIATGVVLARFLNAAKAPGAPLCVANLTDSELLRAIITCERRAAYYDIADRHHWAKERRAREANESTLLALLQEERRGRINLNSRGVPNA